MEKKKKKERKLQNNKNRKQRFPVTDWEADQSAFSYSEIRDKTRKRESKRAV